MSMVPYQETEEAIFNSASAQLSQHANLTAHLGVVDTNLVGFVGVHTQEDFDKAMALNGQLAELAKLVETIEDTANVPNRYVVTEPGTPGKVFRADAPVPAAKKATAAEAAQTVTSSIDLIDRLTQHAVSRLLRGRAQYRSDVWTAISQYSIEPPARFYPSQVRKDLLLQDIPINQSQLYAELGHLAKLGMVEKSYGDLSDGRLMWHIRTNPKAWEVAQGLMQVIEASE